MIYLDHHAATPLCAAAASAMRAAAGTAWANPSSVHRAGRAARALLERAREQVAAAIGAKPPDIVLTSGGTEACNLGVLGLRVPRGAHVVTTAIEHPAVSAAVTRLAGERGVRVTRLAVPAGRAPGAEQLAAAIAKDTALVAVQWINHETGNELPIAAYAEVCARAQVPLFVDATQAPGRVAVDLGALPVSALAIASHKLGGPAGAGALYVARGSELDPRVLGGAQERGRRAGSPDVASAVGFGAACEVLPERLAARPVLQRLAARAQAELVRLGGVINGDAGPRAPSVCNASFRGARGDELVAALDLEGVCASSGAACSSGVPEPSAVLLAMYPEESWRAQSALRLSFGPETTEAELDAALAALGRVLARRVA